MNEAEAIEAIAYLESEYNNQYNGAQRAQIIEVLKQYSGKCVGRAIDALFDENNYLPRASDFKNKVREYGAKEFERAVDKDKREIAMGAEKAFKGDSDGVKYFTMICKMMFDKERRFSREQILDGFRHAASKTGCDVWNSEGAKLQNFMDRSGLDLKEPPATNSCV